MLRLCSLNLMISILLNFFVVPSSAASSIGLESYRRDNYRSSERVSGLPELRNTLITNLTIAQDTRFEGSVSYIIRDYQRYIVRQRNGNERGLSSSDEHKEGAYALNLYRNFAKKLEAGVGYSSNVDSLLPNRTHQLTLAYFSDVGTLTANYLSSKVELPESFYVNRNFQTEKRPNQLTTQAASLSWDMIPKDHLRLVLTGIFGQRLEDRPRHHGTDIKTSYAFTDKWSFHGKAVYRREDVSQPLKDEKGYFEYYFLSPEISYELVYDLVVTAGYGFGLENEFFPDNSTKNHTAMDHFGLGVAYDFGKSILNLNYEEFVSNDGARGFTLQGGYKWKL